jgi:sortase A
MNANLLENLSVEELHRLLMEKKRASRIDRLERFHRTGRVMTLSQDLDNQFHTKREVDKQVQRASLPKNVPRLWVDFSLLSVELLVIFGLVGIILAGLLTLSKINQASAKAFRQSPLTPTPLFMDVVLPEGHTPPNSRFGAQPNEAEIPAHLRPLVQSMAVFPTPTPASYQAIRIQIPAIAVDAPVVQGDGWEQLRLGVAQHIGTPDPGQNGNIVLSGHNDIFGEVFRYLDRLKPGDIVILFTSQKQYTYVITGTMFVKPTQVEVMNPTLNPMLTLISCYPYLIDTQRIIISAVLQNY